MVINAMKMWVRSSQTLLKTSYKGLKGHTNRTNLTFLCFRLSFPNEELNVDKIIDIYQHNYYVYIHGSFLEVACKSEETWKTNRVPLNYRVHINNWEAKA